MSRIRLTLTFTICSLLLFFAIFRMNDILPKEGQSFEGVSDPVTALLFITTVAVAIERLIELFWTVLGGFLGTYWPLNLVSRQAIGIVEDLDNSLKPFHIEVSSRLNDLRAQGKITEEELSNAKEEISKLGGQFNEIKNLPLDNQKLQVLITVASRNINYISKKYGSIIEGVDHVNSIAKTALIGTQAFVETFKDNPGRRLISIYLGMLCGLLASYAFELNIFQLILGAGEGDYKWQVVATGIVIGLGSGPTHEVIRAVQEYKKSKKSSNSSS